MSTVFDCDHFIRKFEAIPNRKWCTGDFRGFFGRRCVYGHCGHNWGQPSTKETQALTSIFEKAGVNAIFVNDGDEASYPQPTPRARILAALHDIKNGTVPR